MGWGCVGGGWVGGCLKKILSVHFSIYKTSFTFFFFFLQFFYYFEQDIDKGFLSAACVNVCVRTEIKTSIHANKAY